jgi:hypothetical protein
LNKYSTNSYYHFDFNAKQESSSQDLNQRIDKFILDYTKHVSTNNFEFASNDKSAGSFKQHFIARINCLDCVDRSNVIASRIGENFVRKVYANILSKY